MTVDELKSWLLLAGFGYRTHSTKKGISFYKESWRNFYEFIIVDFPGDARIIVNTRNTYYVFLVPSEAADHIRSILRGQQC